MYKANLDTYKANLGMYKAKKIFIISQSCTPFSVTLCHRFKGYLNVTCSVNPFLFFKSNIITRPYFQFILPFLLFINAIIFQFLVNKLGHFIANSFFLMLETLKLKCENQKSTKFGRVNSLIKFWTSSLRYIFSFF